MKKVDQHTFKQVKVWLRLRPAKAVARKFDLHESTVLNIRGCRNFDEYREQVKAEHPPIKYSLAEDVYEIHRMLSDQPDYVRPRNAQIAMLDVKQKLASK